MRWDRGLPRRSPINQVTNSGRHSADIRPDISSGSSYLVQMEVRIPADLPAHERTRLINAEADRTQELAAAGTLVQLWRVAGRRANVGIWNAPTCEALHEALESLPLFPFLDIHVVPISRHPNAPATGQAIMDSHV